MTRAASSAEPQTGRTPAIIFDRDGTLASCPLRPADNSGAAWSAFNRAMVFDPVVPTIAGLLRSIRPGVARLLVSGRAAGNHPGDRFRLLEMRNWIEKNDLPIDEVFMRDGGDFRRDAVVKEEILLRDILPRFDVRFAVDDRAEVVQVWRSHGIPVMEVTDPGLDFNLGSVL